jgi:cytoskeletal protein RodZ
LRGLSLEKVAAAIKIRKFFLESIENGNWHELPAEVFARGFIRRYAVFLGLDGDKLIAPYVQNADFTDAKAKEDKPLFEGGDIPTGVWIAIGVGVLLILGLLKLSRMDSKPPKPEAPVTQTTTPAEATVPKSDVTDVEHTIQVHAASPLWLRINAKERSFEGYVNADSTWTWKAEGAFTVRLGRTKDVSMTFDGQPVALKPNQKKIDLPNAN